MKSAVAIDFGGTHMKGALVSSSGKIIFEETRESLIPEGPTAVIGRMAKLIQDIVLKSEGPVLGVGLGCPGPLSISQGTVYGSPNLTHWKSVPIAHMIEDLTSMKVYLDNDANCAALGEYAWGIARGANPLVVLTFGTGIGGGVLIDGKILHGWKDGGGELGHFVIHRGGPLCACGIRGCFEAHCSASAVARRALEGLPKNKKSTLNKKDRVTALAVSEAAALGDPYALSVIEEVSEDMAVGIGGLVNIFNPEMVVLAGGLMRGGKFYLPQIRERLKKYCFPYSYDGLRVELSQLEDRAGILGAARLVFDANSEDETIVTNESNRSVKNLDRS